MYILQDVLVYMFIESLYIYVKRFFFNYCSYLYYSVFKVVIVIHRFVYHHSNFIGAAARCKKETAIFSTSSLLFIFIHIHTYNEKEILTIYFQCPV